jgi:L-arabinose isomerase
MNQYISYLIDNIRAIGLYGTIFIVICYIIYKIKNLYDINEQLQKIVDEQNNNIKIQKKLLNVTQITRPDTISNNFKRMRSKK